MSHILNKVMVGIPVYNDLHSFKMMFDSLLQSTNAFDKIVIIESDSNDGSKEFCDFLQDRYNKVEVIHTPKEGPLKAYNLLFEKAKDEGFDLLITQTDVIFPKLLNRDWLYEMKTISSKVENVGAITTYNGGKYSGKDYIEGFYWLGGWCTYYSNKTLQLVGGYDTEFPNSAYGVDIDHTYRIVQAGLKIHFIDYWIEHHQANTREHDNHPDSEKHKQECALYFRKKWSLGEFKNA